MAPENKFQNDAFIARWISKDLSDAESVEFENWLAAHPEQKRFFDEILQTWNDFENIEFPPELTKKERWLKIKKATNLKIK